jgi:pSer/pThr/pTyr-binding forkhead associated (FHA) protein
VRLGWDEEVSTLHAQIVVVGDECTLVDEGLSRNGSYVNEERVHGRRHLRDGDTVRFGRTAVLYRRPGEGTAEETAVAADVPAAASVSPAQRRVLLALCRPYKDGSSFATPATNQEIGAELHLSVDAVKTHMRALFEKLGVGELPQNQKRVALVERALQSGVISSREL